MAWNSTHFILRQLFGQDTSRVASLCSLTSGPQLGRPEWPGWLIHFQDGFLTHMLSIFVRKMGRSVQLSAYAWRVSTCGLSNVMVSGRWMTPRASLPREPGRSCVVSSDLASDVTVSHFCCIFFSYKWIRGQPRFTKRGMRPTFWWGYSKITLKKSM